jgi:hypothetical protein
VRIYDPLIKSLRGDSITPNSAPCSDDTLSDDTGRSTENQIDADLQRVLDAWPTLPEALRAGILAMIDAARKDG